MQPMIEMGHSVRYREDNTKTVQLQFANKMTIRNDTIFFNYNLMQNATENSTSRR